MYNITGDNGKNVCKKFKVFHIFHQIVNGDWITSVCACTSDREHSSHMSFTRTNNLYWNEYRHSCQCDAVLPQ